jgi:hypothetical protein
MCAPTMQVADLEVANEAVESKLEAAVRALL